MGLRLTGIGYRWAYNFDQTLSYLVWEFILWSQSHNMRHCQTTLRNVLRATTACTFSTSQLPKLVRQWSVFSFFTYKCASHHNGVQFLVFFETQCFATFLPFRAPVSSYFWLFLFSDLLSSALLFSLPLPISALHLPILSEVWLLTFLR